MVEEDIGVVVFLRWATVDCGVVAVTEGVDTAEDRIIDEGIMTLELCVEFIDEGGDKVCFCFDMAIVDDFVVLGVSAFKMDGNEVGVDDEFEEEDSFSREEGAIACSLSKSSRKLSDVSSILQQFKKPIDFFCPFDYKTHLKKINKKV